MRAPTQEQELQMVRSRYYQLQQALRAATAARLNRDQAIARAIDAGCSLREVAGAAGLSRYEASRLGARARKLVRP